MAVSSRKIYQLTELFEPKSNYLLIIRNVETGKDMKVKLGTLLTGKVIPLWDPEEVYPEGQNVDWNLKIWKSLQDNNQGNIPSEGAFWTEVSASEVVSSLPDNLQRVVSKTAHGFSVKNVITLNGSGVHVKVSNPSSDKFVGLVTEVVDANSFRIHTAGYVTGLTGLTAGAIHYAQTDGTLGTTQTDMPVLFADSTSSGYILASGASASSGIRSGDASEGEEGVYTLTLDPAITEYTDGAAFLIRFDYSSINGVGEDTTLNINSLGAKSIRRYPGVPLIPGDINNVQHYFVTYNASSDHFQVHHLPFLPNSVTNKAPYVDTLGRFRIAQGSTYNTSSQAWTHTAATNDGTEAVRWNNSDGHLLFRLLSDRVAEFGTSGAAGFEIPTSIASENAYLLINDDQDVGFRILDRNGDVFLDIKTTNGDKRSILRQPIGKAFTFDFETIIRQVHALASNDDPSAQNILATVEVPSGYYIHVRLKTAIAWSDLGRMISSRPIVAIGFNTGTLEGTAEAPAPIYHGGPANGGFNINFNGSTGEVEIRLENENDGGSGYNYVCDLEFEYTLIPIPAW